MTIPFTGSYSLDDVQFLLKPMAMQDTPVHIKEALIQSGKKHYSQMLTHESLPPEHYLPLFYQAMDLNQQRMAGHLLVLAKRILDTRPHGITLVSLARAGTPVGVLLKHVLKRHSTPRRGIIPFPYCGMSVSIKMPCAVFCKIMRRNRWFLSTVGPGRALLRDNWPPAYRLLRSPMA